MLVLFGVIEARIPPNAQPCEIIVRVVGFGSKAPTNSVALDNHNRNIMATVFVKSAVKRETKIPEDLAFGVGNFLLEGKH